MSYRKAVLLTICLCSIVDLSIQINAKQESYASWINSLNERVKSEDDELQSYQFAKLSLQNITRSKRDLNHMVRFELRDKVITLNLSPVRHSVVPRNLPIWTVEYDNRYFSKRRFQRINYRYPPYSDKFFEDREKYATFYTLEDDQEHVYYCGVIGETDIKLMVEPVKRDYLNEGDPNFRDYIIYEVNRLKYNVLNSVVDEKLVLEYSTIPNMSQPLKTLYPKILLIIEANYLDKFGKDYIGSIRYLLVFWNAVNRKFREIESPEVKITITGIIFAKDYRSLEFISHAYNGSNIDSSALIFGGKEYVKTYLQRELNFSRYDSAVVMTNLRDGDILGGAVLKLICAKYPILVTDQGLFEGLITAIHEMGHALGLSHDPIRRIYNDERSIMYSTYLAGVKKFYWSRQSRNELKLFASSQLAQCLRN